jgi:hypothetical protein
MSERRTSCVGVETRQGLRTLVADQIEGCLALPRLTPLDHTAPWVLGGFELRGELVPVISLDLLAGLDAPIARLADVVVLARSAGFPIGIHAHGPIHPQSDRHGTSDAGQLDALDLATICLGDVDVTDDAEGRLDAFERSLDDLSVHELARRARAYEHMIPPMEGLGDEPGLGLRSEMAESGG